MLQPDTVIISTSDYLSFVAYKKLYETKPPFFLTDSYSHYGGEYFSFEPVERDEIINALNDKIDELQNQISQLHIRVRELSNTRVKPATPTVIVTPEVRHEKKKSFLDRFLT